MPGLMRIARGFNWTLAGKHPAVADYIRLGARSAVLDALTDWVAKGYDVLQRAGHPLQTGCSWRFWLRGAKKQELICGLCRDSSDCIGRPFPLLIMGEGMFKDLEKTWPLLPARLDKVWVAMEYIAAHRFDHLQAMADELQALDIAAAATAGGPPAGGDEAVDAVVDERMVQCRHGLQTSGWGLVSLAGVRGPNTAPDPGRTAALCHARLQACCSDMPRAVFLGGPLLHPYMLVLQEALKPSDFMRLWTV
jgi:type VI secretion system ImpM family protein